MNTKLQPYLLVALCWACCLSSSIVFAQDRSVYEGDLTFFTQAELDNFSYTRVKGDLTIGTFSDTLGTGTSLITDLSPLQKLTRVEGTLSIALNNKLKTLKGLKNLCRVEGTLIIYGNDYLTTLEGLDQLQHVGNDLVLEINDRLQSLRGLEKLTTIRGALVLDANNGLTTLSGLDNLRLIGEGFAASDNDALSSLEGLSGLDSVRGLGIVDNDVLSSLTGLNPSVVVSGNANLVGNPQLAECCIVLDNVRGTVRVENNAKGCNSLTEVEQACSNEPVAINCASDVTLTTQAEVDAFKCTSVESLTINVDGTNSDPITNLKALCSLKTIANNLTISAIGVPQLTSLEGLHGLTSIGGNFNFEAADISSMKGLENLKTIGGQLSVYRTPLISFQGLGSLTTIEGAFVLNDIASGDEPISFQGLSVLQSVGGIFFTDKDVLAEDFTGLESLKIIRGNLSIGGTEVDGVSSLKGLEGVEEITGDIQFSYERFTSFEGLNNLQRLGGGIILEDNAIESFDGLEKLEVIEGQLIALNNRIDNVKGLRSLQTAGGINISDEPLGSLDGLEQLRQVNGTLGFNSTRITDLSPLQGIEAIAGNLSLVGNSDLTECCIIPSLVAATQGEVIINNNAPACSSLEAIQENCDEPVTTIDCSQEEVILTTQAQIDAFNCTRVSSLTITGEPLNTDPITSLANLSSLTAIDNDLTIRLVFNDSVNTNLGLSNLTRVGGDFVFKGNTFNGLDKLTQIGGNLSLDAGAFNTNFEGLERLESIGGSLSSYLSNFVSFKGLTNLKTIGDGIFVRSPSKRFSFEGLSALEQVEGFSLFGSDVIDFAGLSSLEKIRFLSVVESGISSFAGLDNLKEITGNISFEDGGVVSWEGLENLRRVGGDISVRNGNTGDFIGLEKLEEIGGEINLENSNLTNFEGLPSLRSVKNIILFGVQNLSSLNGIEQLEVNGNFRISDGLIEDVSSLENVEVIAGDLILIENSRLSTCCIIPTIADRVQGEIILQDNAPECNSLEAIEENCAEEAPDENARTAQALKAYPNPSANFVQIQVDQPTVVQLFSTAGNLVKEQRVEQEGTLDLTTVKAGVYLLKAPGRMVQRIIKK